MAYGFEIVLGWKAEDFAKASKLLGIQLPVEDEDWEGVDDEGGSEWVWERGSARLVDNLVTAQRSALLGLGYSPITGGKATTSSYLRYSTPWGEREIARFSPQFYYDPDEMGDEPEDAVFGLSIAGRYYPRYLDVKNLRGTPGNFAFDAKAEAQISLLREVMKTHCPGFAVADVIVVRHHY